MPWVDFRGSCQGMLVLRSILRSIEPELETHEQDNDVHKAELVQKTLPFWKDGLRMRGSICLKSRLTGKKPGELFTSSKLPQSRQEAFVFVLSRRPSRGLDGVYLSLLFPQFTSSYILVTVCLNACIDSETLPHKSPCGIIL